MKKIVCLIVFVVALLVGLIVSGNEQEEFALQSQDKAAGLATEIPSYGRDSGAEADLSMQAMPDDVPQQILKRTAYTASYNKDTRCPNWVYWCLTAEHTDGPYPRDRKFYADEEVPSPRAEWNDYKGTGWSRGHLCPAGDNKWSEKAMHETFLMSNIVPQNRNLNNGDWKELEVMCRNWAKEFGEVHIVSGPLPYKKPWETISKHDVVVPRALFKVVLCVSDTPKAIGFVYKNQAQNNPKQFYVNTVDEVERLTDIDFFPALPDDIEESVESNYKLSEWGL